MDLDLVREIGISDTLLLVRVDFEHPAAWHHLLDTLAVPSPEGFRPYFHIVDDPRWAGVTADLAVTALHTDGADPAMPFLFLVDHATLTGPERAIQAVDTLTGDTFRFTPQVAWIVDNNLLVGNMDFTEFAEHVDQDGVYRG